MRRRTLLVLTFCCLLTSQWWWLSKLDLYAYEPVIMRVPAVCVDALAGLLTRPPTWTLYSEVEGMYQALQRGESVTVEGCTLEVET